MGKFLTHEPVCNGIFNRDYTSGINALLPWEKDLKNSPESLALMCQRMELDYSQTRPKLRKTWNMTTLDIWLAFNYSIS